MRALVEGPCDLSRKHFRSILAECLARCSEEPVGIEAVDGTGADGRRRTHNGADRTSWGSADCRDRGHLAYGDAEYGKTSSTSAASWRPAIWLLTAAIAIKFRCDGAPVRRKIMFTDRKIRGTSAGDPP